MAEWMNNEVLGITIGQYATALGIVLVAYVAKKLFAYLFIKVLLPLAQKSQKELDDRFLACLQKPAEFLIFLVGLFIATEVLQLPSDPFDFVKLSAAILKALVIFDIAWFLFNMVDMIDHYLAKWASRTKSTLDDHLAPHAAQKLAYFHCHHGMSHGNPDLRLSDYRDYCFARHRRPGLRPGSQGHSIQYLRLAHDHFRSAFSGW